MHNNGHSNILVMLGISGMDVWEDSSKFEFFWTFNSYLAEQRAKSFDCEVANSNQAKVTTRVLS